MARTASIPERKKTTTYRYVAATRQGKLVKGTIKAVNEITAERLLIEQGYDPQVVEAAPSMFSLEEALPSLFKIKRRDVITFSRQLATLIRAGISLMPALEILQGQVGTSRAFRSILGSVVNDIRSGSSFYIAIQKHPTAFSDIYCRSIAVGQESGSMVDVLNQMAYYLERESGMTQKLRKALTYPAMILGTGVVVVFVLMTVVMPNLLGMFTAMNVELPLPTRMLIVITNIFTDYQLYILIVVALLAALVLWLVKQPAGRRLLDRWRLIVPVIGPPALMTELGRIARTLSMLVGAGLSLQEVMEVLPRSTSNKAVQSALQRVSEGLLLGEGLSEPMSRVDIFPSLLVQMVAVGEETNTLESTMGVVADFYEATASESIDAMVGMIGPLSTMAISVLVGFIALSVMMPMYTIIGAVG